MIEINLKKAREILKEQGYEIKLDYKEAVMERFSISEDSYDNLHEKMTNSLLLNRDDTLEELENAASEFIQKHRCEINDTVIKQMDKDDALSEVYLNIIDDTIRNILEKEVEDFSLNLLTATGEKCSELEKVLVRRKYRACWYVLHYDKKTTEYLNEIVFLPLAEAIVYYLYSEPFNDDDRVELMFAPDEDDEEFSDNFVVTWKEAKKKA